MRPSWVFGMQCWQYAYAIMEDSNFHSLLGDAGFKAKIGDVYPGHIGVYIYQDARDMGPPLWFVAHVGSGANPQWHTSGEHWPIKINFPGDKLLGLPATYHSIIPLDKQNSNPIDPKDHRCNQ